MQVKDRAIVLQCVKYNDKKFILKLYTSQHGLITVHASSSGAKSAKLKSSSLQLLQIIDVDYSYRQNKDIQQLHEAVPFYCYVSITSDFRKLSVFQFLAEMLLKVLKEQQGNRELFHFICSTLISLDSAAHMIPHFHHVFLIQVLTYLGIHPVQNFSEVNAFFDCREGKFSPIELPFPMGFNKELSQLLQRSFHSDFMHQSITYTERELLLEGILQYYQFHVPGFGKIKSIDVLKEISAV